jgi:hypothetical protein
MLAKSAESTEGAMMGFMKIKVRRNYEGEVRGVLEVGGWKLEAGGWRLEVGGWKLEVGSWKLEVGGWRVDSYNYLEERACSTSWLLRSRYPCPYVHSFLMAYVRSGVSGLDSAYGISWILTSP